MLRFLLISAILCIVLFHESHSRMSLDKFFKFGDDHDEKEFSDGKSRRIDVDPPFRIFGKMQDYAYVHTQGTISFGGGLAKVFYVNDANPVGNFFYRHSTEAADLEKARLDIGSAFPAFQDIDLKWAVIATWQKQSYGNWWPDRNTFQAVLTTDGVRSFAMFYYNDTDWRKDTSIGFQLIHDTIVYKYVVEGSATKDALTMEHRSNMNSAGKWIFRIDLPKIYESSSMCPKPPQPMYGFCRAFPEYTLDYTPNAVLFLNCWRPAPNKTVNWIGNIPVCRLSTKDKQNMVTAQENSNSSASAIRNVRISLSKNLTCPPPPMPQNAICEEMAYVPGSAANCTCLPNHHLKNPGSDFYCSFAKDGSLFWQGELPVCALNSDT